MKKLLVALALIGTSGLASAYTLQVNNQSNYQIKVYNGATSDTHYVQAHSSQSMNLINGNSYQIQYTYTDAWGRSIPDNLGNISEDNNNGWVTVSLSQPAVPAFHQFTPDDPRYAQETVIPWQLASMRIGNNTYQTPVYLRNWPKAPIVAGCDNRDWGTMCNANGSSGTYLEFNNNSYPQ